MSIQTEINRINGEVSAQTQLISQIQTALEGKAADSGGSGGGSIETCTVTVTSFGYINSYCYTAHIDGEIVAVASTQYADTELTLNNVICGSVIYICNSYDMNGYSCIGGVEIIADGYRRGFMVKAPTTNGANGVLTIFDND